LGKGNLTDKNWISEQDEWSVLLTGEMIMNSLLARILLSVPEREWIGSLLDDDIFSSTPFAEEQPDVIAGREILLAWASDNQNGLDDNELTSLQVDNTRLFTGIPKIPVVPWESVYFTDERLVFQESTLDVRAWYRRYGLESVDLYKEPDDHIGLEISFLGHLAKLALAAYEEQNESKFEEYLSAQRDFLSQHLILWGPLWSSLMIKHSKTRFYKGIALLTRGLLLELADLFDLKVPDYIDA
jgi:TorA maturation chaperone TorD